MRPALSPRRVAALAVIASVTALTVAIAFHRTGVQTEATREPSRLAAFAGAEVGHAAAAAEPGPLMCVDPGHSLTQPGMVVSVPVSEAGRPVQEHELREVDINLDVAREVTRRLRARFGDQAIVMTWGEADGRSRSWDALRGPAGDEKPDVIARGAFCVAERARSVVSVHTNWFGDAPNGTFTGFRDENDRALAAAVHFTILDAMRVIADAPDDPFIDYGLEQGEWQLTLGFGDRDVPAVILEPVLMSNPDEARRLVPTIAAAPDGRRAQIAAVEAAALGDWIASTLLDGR